MIYAIKRAGESNERLISRFKKVVQRSRVLVQSKEGRYHSRPQKKNYLRAAAIKKAEYRTKRAKEQFYSAQSK